MDWFLIKTEIIFGDIPKNIFNHKYETRNGGRFYIVMVNIFLEPKQ